MPTRAADRGVGAAAKQVAEHASALARLELELAQLELKQKLAPLSVGTGLVAGAGLLALYMLGFGLAAIAAGLALAVPTWAALLIVAGGLALVAAVCGLIGLRQIRKGSPPVPEQAIEEARKTGDAIRSSNGDG